MKKIGVIFLFLSLQAQACFERFHAGAFVLSHNSATEEDYNRALEKFESVFSPIVEKELNAKLIIPRLWQYWQMSYAAADRKMGVVKLTIYGGTAIHPDMTMDAFDQTLCHEMGHVIGGYPKKPFNPHGHVNGEPDYFATISWATSEAQADYYSTAKCLRLLWEGDDHVAKIGEKSIPAVVQRECSLSFSKAQERALCIRMSLASKATTKMLGSLINLQQDSEFETPDETIVEKMNFYYPSNQCRLDSMFQGALCTIPKEQAFSDNDETIGACIHQERGARPRCWFLPNESL